jgi:phosphatidylinositol dimannoside acyltransferase
VSETGPPRFDDGLRRFGQGLTANVYKLGSMAAQLTPGPIAQASATAFGFSMAATMRSKRSMVERHLTRVNPRLSGFALRTAVQQSFDSYARYWVESFRLPALSRRTVDAGFTIDGWSQVTDALDHGGKGVILALPHLGGWEWAGRWMAEQGRKLTVVVEPLENKELFDWFRDLRSKLGMTVVPLGPEAGSTILKALHSNEAVCLLCDRDIQGGGIPVEFFGEQTTLPAGPATLALRTGAPILPVGVYFTNRYNGHHCVVRPPLRTDRRGKLRDDITRVTQDLARELEFLIGRAPEQWHLFQPNWPSDPGYGSELRIRTLR